MNKFEQASREGLRFSSSKGALTVEDLWDLPLTSARYVSLDTMAKTANKYLKETEEESFVNVKTTSNTFAELRLDILKHIIAVKLTEMGAANEAIVNKAKKEKILAILANKQDAVLESQSEAELKALLETL